MTDPPPMTLILGWTVALPLAALCLALVVGAHVATSFAMAYVAAPRDLVAFLDAADVSSSVPVHESYDDDDDDEKHLGRGWREIHQERNGLRRHLDQLLRRRADGSAALTTGARLLWAGHRRALEARVRRLDRRRMRFFLDAYGGVAASSAAAGGREKAEAGGVDAENDAPSAGARRVPPGRPVALAEAIRKPAALRRLTTPAARGPGEKTPPPLPPSPPRAGWVGVVQELRESPRMHKRHASIELSMRSPPRFGHDATPSPERRLP